MVKAAAVNAVSDIEQIFISGIWNQKIKIPDKFSIYMGNKLA